MKRTNLMALAATAALAFAGPLYAGITFREAAKAKEGKEAHRMLIPVRESSRTSLSKGTPGKSGIALRSRRSLSNPSRIIGNGASVYGYLSTSVSEEQKAGLYELTPEGYTLKWKDEYAHGGSKLTNGWIEGDRLCGYTIASYWGMIFTFDYIEINMADGTTAKTEEFDYYRQPNISTAAFSTGERAIYGYASSPEDGSAGWVRADADKPGEPVFLRMLSDPEAGSACYSLTYNPDDEMFYGVNMDQKFVRIDADGRQTVIADVPDAGTMANVITGMAYSPKENLFYWNYNTADRESGIYSITKDGEFNLISTFSDGEEMTCLVCTDAFVATSKPLRPEISAISFEGGAVSGSITFTLPAEFTDGSPIDDNLAWHALLDGVEYKDGTAQAGSAVTVDFSELPDGFHNFALYTDYNGTIGARTSTRMFIGADTPKAPVNVVLTDSNVSWDAVTEGINGGYIDPAAITYEVMIDGKSYGTTTSTSLDITLPGGDFKQYTAEVYAEYSGNRSAAGSSNPLVHGDDMTLPIHFEVTEEEFNLMTIVDANDDDYNWIYSYGLTALLADWIYDESPTMDDYIYLPPIKFDSADKLYTLSMDMIARSTRYPDAMYEVVVATRPDAESVCKTILGPQRPPYPAPDVDDVDYEHFVNVKTLFSVDVPGTYYIGFHCVSPAAQMGFLIRNINITDENITDKSPAAVTDAVAKGAENGVLSANVTFTLPTVDLAGNTLPSGSELTATVSCVNSATVTGRPGEKVTADVETLQGDNNILIRTNLDGSNSPKAIVTVFTGVHPPKSVSSVSAEIAPDMRSATLTWPAVTESEDGGYINPATVEYEIYTLGYNMYGDQEWQLLDECGTSTSYVFTPDMQDLHFVAVGTKNEAGDNGRIYWLNILAGPPCELPMTENFADGYVNISPWLSYAIDDTYTASLGSSALADIDPRWSDSEDYAMVMVPEAAGTNGMMGIPRFTTATTDEAILEMEILTGPNAPEIAIYGDYYGSENLVYVGSVSDTEDALKTISFELPSELMGRDWVQIYVLCRFPDADRIFVMNSISINKGGVSVDGIHTAASAIRAGKGEIIFDGFNGCDINVMSLDGKTIGSTKATSGITTIKVDKGIYVAKAGQKTAKVVVR